MSMAAAQALLDRIESDEALASQLQASQSDPAEVYRLVQEAGFAVEPEEVKVAFLARYGSDLTTEQLELVAGGFDTQAAMYGALAGVGLVGAMAAAAVG